MSIRSAKGIIQNIGDGASPQIFGPIGQVRSLAGPSTKATVQDVTTHSTAGNYMEKLATLIDPGTISFPINYDKDDETHQFATGLWSRLIALTLSDFETILPASFGELDYAGYLTSHSFTLPVDNVMQVDVEITISGALTATN